MWNVEFCVIEEMDTTETTHRVRYRLHAMVQSHRFPVGDLHDTPALAALAFIEAALAKPSAVVELQHTKKAK